jgi:hypothetical protein
MAKPGLIYWIENNGTYSDCCFITLLQRQECESTTWQVKYKRDSECSIGPVPGTYQSHCL